MKYFNSLLINSSNYELTLVDTNTSRVKEEMEFVAS